MMKHLASLITSLSLFLAASAPASQTPNTFMPVTWQSPLLKDHPLVGHIIALESQRSLSPTELVSELSQYPIVLIGEKHDNADHHQIETWLIQQLYPSDSANTSLVLEMLDDSQTTNTIISGMSDSDLKQRLNWQDDSWPWQDYGPLIKAALEQNMPVLSGNISRDAIHTIYKAGVPKTQRLASTQGITQAVKDQVLDQVYESHCQLMQRNQLAPMVSVQLARDASLAYAIKQRSTDNVILVAGGFHTDKSVGVPLHLSPLEQQHTRTILLVEVDATHEQAKDYTTLSKADYVWFTPKANNTNYCDDLRQQWQKKSPSHVK